MSLQPQKAINLLSVCRKAGKLVWGFDSVKEKILLGKAACIIAADDISQKTLKELRFFSKDKNIRIISIGADSDAFLEIIGKKTVAAAVCDKGFADALIKLGTDAVLSDRKQQ